MKKVALIVGHDVEGKSKGAINYLGEYESTFNFRIAKKVKSKLKDYDISVKIFTTDLKLHSTIGYEVSEFMPSMSLELHFNSFSSPAFGCEVLALEDDIASQALARLVAANISYSMGIKRRRDQGLYIISKGGRGFNNLNYLKIYQKKYFPKVLVEPCFANIKTKESQYFFEKEDEYVECLVKVVKTQLNLEPNNHTPDIRTPKPSKTGLRKSPKNIIDRIIIAIKKFFKGMY